MNIYELREWSTLYTSSNFILTELADLATFCKKLIFKLNIYQKFNKMFESAAGLVMNKLYYLRQILSNI